MLFVGPLENVRMGHFFAVSVSMSVPSFCVRKRGQDSSPRDRMAVMKPEMVFRANLMMDAFSMDAFSRSRNPMFPT